MSEMFVMAVIEHRGNHVHRGYRGSDIGQMSMVLLHKVEELTLHLIEQNKLIDKLQASSASADASGKKVEELTLHVIELKKRDEAMQKELNALKKKKLSEP
jgi:predicted transcriptional regulator